MNNVRKYSPYFSEEVKNADSRRNIDDVWWVKNMYGTREELEKTNADIKKLETIITRSRKKIAKVDYEISRKQNGVDAIDCILKFGVIFAMGTFIVSILACGFTTGVSIWAVITFVQSIAAITAKGFQISLRQEIKELGDNKEFEVGNLNNYNIQYKELTNKRDFLNGKGFNFQTKTGDSEYDRPMIKSFQYDINDDSFVDYNTETFIFDELQPRYERASQLIKRINEVEKSNNSQAKKR